MPKHLQKYHEVSRRVILENITKSYIRAYESLLLLPSFSSPTTTRFLFFAGFHRFKWPSKLYCFAILRAWSLPVCTMENTSQRHNFTSDDPVHFVIRILPKHRPSLSLVNSRIVITKSRCQYVKTMEDNVRKSVSGVSKFN